jgi:hypothetical protein
MNESLKKASRKLGGKMARQQKSQKKKMQKWLKIKK